MGRAAPGHSATYDVDARSGVTGTPEQDSLWAAWAAIATQREAANRLAGQAGACLAAQGDAR